MTPANTNCPTPDPELNAVQHELVTSTQAVLGDNFIGAYLQGSFAVGDWDAHSDVDWLIAERARQVARLCIGTRQKNPTAA
jgi:hypothetical protein